MRPVIEVRMALRTKDFDYHLPDELIASRPLAERAASRMMVVHRGSGRIEHRMFRELPEFLLPHYMGREDEIADKERYQTVYAREEGAIAAPTAGLHFTPEMLADLPHAFLTLHVGVGTFRPVKAEVVSEHLMHSEKYAISAETARRVNAAGRVIAVGTTVTRVLESLGRAEGPRLDEKNHTGETDIFIHPPYDFRVIGGMLTNFHLPQSTLIMLVSAFAGRELVLEAYLQAVAGRYRFYSYGDCMLLL